MAQKDSESNLNGDSSTISAVVNALAAEADQANNSLRWVYFDIIDFLHLNIFQINGNYEMTLLFQNSLNIMT